MNVESTGLATIVDYSAAVVAFNGYPNRIVSPTESGPCCVTGMRLLGETHWGENGPYNYKQCQVCTDTVRQFAPVE